MDLPINTDGTTININGLKESLRVIVKLSNIYDTYLYGHLIRVTALSSLIGSELNLNQDELDCLEFASMLHDIGKLYIPLSIINKKNELTDDEIKEIHTHPVIGANLIQNIPFPCDVYNIIYQHHERLDGSGYPNGLKGDAIHKLSQILAVADVAEAAQSYRVYRNNLKIVDVMQLLTKDGLCGKLNMEYVTVCNNILKKYFSV